MEGTVRIAEFEMNKEMTMKTDKELQQDVLDELVWEPSVDAAEIGVSVKTAS